MARRDLVIAIDGPSGSGKSTVARAVARALGLRYLDTGAMYRAVTWLVLDAGLDLSAVDSISALATTAPLELSDDPNPARVVAGGVDVTSQIRGPEVTGAVSAVSAIPAVRTAMVARQRAIIGEGGIVVEGRDIGSTVAPDAPVKVFLTADPAERARRRTRQDTAGSTVRTGAQAGRSMDDGGRTDTAVLSDRNPLVGAGPLVSSADRLAITEADLVRRDRLDSTRAASPLALTEGAVEIDSSGLGVAEVVAEILSLVDAADRQ